MINGTLSKLNHNGVVVKLDRKDEAYIVTISYAKRWKEKGHKDSERVYYEEDIAKMTFRMAVMDNISIF